MAGQTRHKQPWDQGPGQRDVPRIVGPRYGDPKPPLTYFMPAKNIFRLSLVPSFAKSPCRGAARRWRGGGLWPS